ncbi:MAG: EAL domain-containing protein [Candidatus Thiodiazotropha endolucinida]
MHDNQQHTILIVDDNQSNLELLYELLSREGYLVKAANSAHLGLNSALSSPPDLILLDIKMPEMNGYEMCAELKKKKVTESIPVIFISASSVALNKVEAFAVGGVDYIVKPFETSEVLARVKNHLQLSLLQKQTEQSLNTSQSMLQAIISHSPAIIFIKDIEGYYIMLNEEFERVTNIKIADAIGKTDDELFDKESAQIFRMHDNDAIEKAQHKQFEETLNFGDEERTFLSLKFPLINSQGKVFALCCISTDITQRKQAEVKLHHLATHDTLTQLPNRAAFMEILAHTVASGKRKGQRHAILFIDLDNFKNINDSLGHEIGDQLLKKTAERLKENIHIGDFVSRMGGDEFMLLLQDINHPQEAARVSEKIINAMSAVFEIGDQRIFITPSIGIATTSDDGIETQKLVRNADIAMYCAKSRGRNNYQFFTEEMNSTILQRMEIEREFRIALDKGQILPMYQPQIDIITGEIVGVEALARWHHPKLGTISPSVFIPIADEINLLYKLDHQIITQAIKDFAPLIKTGHFKGTVSGNVCPKNFKQKQLVEFIDEETGKYGFPKQNLGIEITENAMMKNTEQVIQLMTQIKEQHINISIDDFGTGYSSLSYLKQFPIQTLKIDISFIRDINKSLRDKNLVKTIIELAHGLGLDCIAEGVETTEQAQTLRELGCDRLQGYLFSRAIPFDEISLLLNADKEHTFSTVDKQAPA